eukprot:366518-Chlamydomonas_euryale.AAC.3
MPAACTNTSYLNGMPARQTHISCLKTARQLHALTEAGQSAMPAARRHTSCLHSRASRMHSQKLATKPCRLHALTRIAVQPLNLTIRAIKP